jgi:hypothetical protein
MALVTAKTRCAICGDLLASAKASALPAFVRNAKDPLYALSGRVFHASCLREHPLREAAMRNVAERKSRMSLPVFVCVVCGASIQTDGCSTDLLTTDPGCSLYRFNYMNFHKSHLADWGELADFKKSLEEGGRLGIWEGSSMVDLLL